MFVYPMWYFYGIDNEASCSVPFRRKHLSTDAKQIVTYEKRFNSSDAIAETYALKSISLR